MGDDRLKDVSANGTPQNDGGLKRRDLLLSGSSLLAASALSATGLVNPAQAQQPAPAVPGPSGRPNILIIMTDDVGVWNLSTYHRGMMGGRTPNIDRIAQEGALFTDYYGQQSCTAGRSAFITGQHPFRTGRITEGRPDHR
jgi:arylsulfatase